MTLRKLIISLTFISILAMSARISMDSDSWWHLRTGQWISENQSVPKSDTFSHTRLGQAWRYPSAAWISQWGMYQLYELAGPAALNIAVALIVTATFAILYFTLTGGPFLRALILILAAASSGVYWSARPHLASFFFFALFLWMLEDYRWKRKRHLFFLPFVLLVWVNSHPGFLSAFILLSIYAADEIATVLSTVSRQSISTLWQKLRESKFPHYLAIGLLMLVAASINPSGPSILTYPFETLSIDILRDFIQEWQSPDFHNLSLQPFLWTVLLLIAFLGFSKKAIALSDLLLVTIFAYMAFLAGRNVALFALASAPVLARHAFQPINELAGRFKIKLRTRFAPSRNQRILNTVLLLLFLILAAVKIAQVIPLEKNREEFSRQLPIGAIRYLKQNSPEGKLFNSYNWGGYLIWALPQYPVFADGRTDLYSDELLSQWLQIVAAEANWQANLEKWDIKLILLEPHWPLVKLLDQNGWDLLFSDDLSLLYARSSNQ